jgi:hypothetical protein
MSRPVSVPRLKGGSNYLAWSFCVEAMLMEEQINITGEDAIDNAVKRATALRIIRCSIHQDLMNRFVGILDPKALWQAIYQQFGQDNTASRFTNLMILLKATKKPGESVSQFINRTITLKNKINTSRIKLEDRDPYFVTDVQLIAVILNGLPEDVKNRVIDRLKDDLTIDNLEAKLQELDLEDLGTRSNPIEVNSVVRKKVKQKKKPKQGKSLTVKCFQCGKQGHIAKECKSKFTVNVIECSFVSEGESNNWLVDSCAGAHIIGDESLLLNGQEVHDVTVRFADEKEINVVKMGNLVLEINGAKVELDNCLVVPTIRKKIISVGALTEKEINVTFEKDYCCISNQTFEVYGFKANNIYDSRSSKRCAGIKCCEC